MLVFYFYFYWVVIVILQASTDRAIAVWTGFKKIDNTIFVALKLWNIKYDNGDKEDVNIKKLMTYQKLYCVAKSTDQYDTEANTPLLAQTPSTVNKKETKK